jgi:hypothetical protein
MFTQLVCARRSTPAVFQPQPLWLPNVALWDQGAPPAAARWACHLGTVAASIPARQAPASLRLAAGRRGSGDRRQRHRWRRTGDTRAAVSLPQSGRSRGGSPWRAGHGDRRPPTLRAIGQWAPGPQTWRRHHPDTARVGDALQRCVKAGQRALVCRCGALDPAVCRGGAEWA